MPETVARGRTSVHKQTRNARRRKVRRLVALFAFAMLLLVGGVAGALYWKYDNTMRKITQSGENGTSPGSQNLDPTYHSDKPMSIVLLGRDTRPETGSLNTDVMIVAVANPVTKKVTMVSLPRDTRVKIPGYRGYRKINEVYADGEAERRQAERNNEVPVEDGISLTKKTLTELLGIPIEHYVTVDFEGFKAVIDELGGVEVNVDKRLVYDDPTDGTHIDLKPGLQLLNGEQALGYVRHRKDNRGPGYYSSDFDRSRRQQEVIKAIVDKASSLNGLTKIFNIMDVGAEHIRTDLSREQIEGLAFDFKGLSSTSITVLDNGAYWKTPYTYFPKENLYAIRSALQAEMGLTGSVVAELNDSPVFDGGSDTETVTNIKPSKPKTTESAAPSTTQQKPKPVQPAQEQQENQEETPQTPSPDQEGSLPPPDIVPPDQLGTPGDGGSTPPPDIVPPTGQDVQPDSSTS